MFKIITAAWRSRRWQSAHTARTQLCWRLHSAHLGDLQSLGRCENAVRTPLWCLFLVVCRCRKKSVLRNEAIYRALINAKVCSTSHWRILSKIRVPLKGLFWSPILFKGTKLQISRPFFTFLFLNYF